MAKNDFFLLLDIDNVVYEDKSYIVLVLRNLSTGKKHLMYDPNYRPYFYVIPNNQEHIKDLADEIGQIRIFKGDDEIKPYKVEIVTRKLGFEEIKCAKVYLKKPSHYMELKDIIKNLPHYGRKIEKDIPFTKSYLADKGISSGRRIFIEYEEEENKFTSYGVKKIGKIISVKEMNEYLTSKDIVLMSIDIETSQENGRNDIIMISYATNQGDKGVFYVSNMPSSLSYAFKVSSEKELIEKISKKINDIEPDIIFTYNGDDFDFDIIKSKIDNYKLPYKFGFAGKNMEKEGRRQKAYRIFGRVHFDLYRFVSSIIAYTLNAEVLSLDAVAQELIGEGKKEVRFEEISKTWEENIDKIIEYSLNDAEITLKLGEFLLPTFLSLSDITKLLLYDISRATYGNLVEHYAIRRSRKLGVLIPNKPKQSEITERYYAGEYEGAYVYEPKPGLYEDIVVLDFKSLYPSIIITHNIDPHTITFTCENNPNKVPDFDYCFLEKPQGFIPSAMKHIYDKRVITKDMLKKLDRNSKEYAFYKAEDYALKTILNSFYGYLGYPNSRWYKKECAQAATSFGRYYIRRIINEMESRGYKVIYGDTDSVFVLLGNKSIDNIMKVMNEINSALPGIIKLDFQGYYKRGIFVKRKEDRRGAKKRYALVDEKGNVLIRGFERVRRDWCKLAKDMQENILKYVLEGQINKAKEHVRRVIDQLKKGEINKEDLIIYVKLQKSLDSYESLAPHIAVAKKLKMRGKKIFSGMIIPYIITSKPGKISEKAEIYYEAKDYDVDYYINHQVLPAALRVLEPLGITKEEIMSGRVQKKLF